MKTIISLFFMLLLISCGVNETNSFFPEGSYEGSFNILASNGNELTGNVQFSFRENKYTCLPTIRYLPPVGAGTYRLNENEISFNDTAAHTAEFDHTLILGGNFSYTYVKKVLVLHQNDKAYSRERTITLRKIE